jgi:hypothetical protein
MTLTAEFFYWKEHYKLQLRDMYLMSMCLCFKNEMYMDIDWKHNKNFNLFCSVLYNCSSKKIVEI